MFTDYIFYQRIGEVVSQELKDEFKAYLKGVFKKRKAKAAENDKQKNSRAVAAQLQAARGEALADSRKRSAMGTPQTDSPPGTGQSNPRPGTPIQNGLRALGNVVASASKFRINITRSANPLKKKKKNDGLDGQVEVPATTAEMKKECNKLVTSIKSDVNKFRELNKQMKAMDINANAGNEENADADSSAATQQSKPAFRFDANATVHYNVHCRSGKMKVDGGVIGEGIMLVEDFEDNLDELPASIDNEEKEQTRRGKNMHLYKYGAMQQYIPCGTEIVGTNYLNTMKNAYQRHAGMFDSMDDLFDGSQLKFSYKAKALLAIAGVQDYGGSDEGFRTIMMCTFKAFFHEIGYKVSHENLSKAIPSRRTIARGEHRLATDCLLKVIWEIKKDGSKHVSIITDHGHRGGQDHFVIVVIWSGKDPETGRMTTKAACPSIDSAGHTAEQASDAVKTVFERFLSGVAVIQGEVCNCIVCNCVPLIMLTQYSHLLSSYLLFRCNGRYRWRRSNPTYLATAATDGHLG